MPGISGIGDIPPRVCGHGHVYGHDHVYVYDLDFSWWSGRCAPCAQSRSISRGMSGLGVPVTSNQSWWAARVAAMWKRWRDSSSVP